MSVRSPSRTRGFTAATLAAVTTLAPSVIVGGVALWKLQYACDESCRGGGWTNSIFSPVWTIQFWVLAFPALIAAAMFVYFIAVGRRKGGLASLALTTCLTGGWVVLYAVGGQGGSDISGLALVAVQLAGGFPALSIGCPPQGRSQRPAQ